MIHTGNTNTVSLYTDSISSLGFSFNPDRESSIYYVDPFNKSLYISLECYFEYRKQQMLVELQDIAQCLGAKYFSVTYIVHKKALTANNIKAGASGQTGKGKDKTAVGVRFEHSRSNDSDYTFELAARNEYAGHDPLEPTLLYFAKEPQILHLIASRMSLNPMTKQEFTFDIKSMSGIKEKDAINIDTTLKTLKLAGNTSIASEASNEARKSLKYEISF